MREGVFWAVEAPHVDATDCISTYTDNRGVEVLDKSSMRSSYSFIDGRQPGFSARAARASAWPYSAI